MNTDVVARSILASFHRLPSSERSIVKLLSVYRTLDADIVDYTARALRSDHDSAHILRLPMVEPSRRAGDTDFRLRPLLRRFLLERLRDEDAVTYHRAHRLAAGYFYQSLEPLRVGRLRWYIEEIHHLAASHPGHAFSRLADFSHAALMAGHPEAASRGAAEAAQAADAPDDLKFLADVVRLVSEILASPTQVDERAIIRLDGILTASRPSNDLAALRISQLARDLVTYYSVRLAPAPRMSTALAPAVFPGSAAGGVPEISAALSLAEGVAHFPHSVISRAHKVEIQGTDTVLHSIKTTLYTQRSGTPTRQPVDLFPIEAGDTLDSLEVLDANGWPVHSLKVIETQTYLASAVSSWLRDAESAEPQSESMALALRQEISQSLENALQNREHETVGQLLQMAADQSDGHLHRRIQSATRYLPLVADLDANSGTSQKLQYSYEGPCQVRRARLTGVEVSLELLLPTQVRNRLEIPRLDGLELANVHLMSEVPHTLAVNSNRQHWPQSHPREAPGQFTVVFSDGDEGDAPDSRLSRADLDLLYVVRKEDLARVRHVNFGCLAACLLSIYLPYALNGAVWSNIISWLTTILILADALYKNGRADPAASNQELRATASRPTRIVLGINVLGAVVAAASSTSGGSSDTTFAICMASLGVCLLTTPFIFALSRQRNRLIRYPVLDGRL